MHCNCNCCELGDLDGILGFVNMFDFGGPIGLNGLGTLGDLSDLVCVVWLL